MIKHLLIFLFLLHFIHQVQAQTPSYIFQSGFEGSSKLTQYTLNGRANPNNADISGRDGNYDWVRNLDDNPAIGSFRIFYEIGDTSKSKAEIVIDPKDTDNHVLKYQISAPHITYTKNGKTKQKGRIQVGINRNPNWKELHHSQKLLLHKDLQLIEKYEGKITWFTLQEYWNNNSHEPFPFRVTLNMQKEEGEDQSMFFGAHGQIKNNGVWESVWELTNKEFNVQFDEWFTLTTHFIEGDKETGHFKVTVTDEHGNIHTIFDHIGYTHHPNDPNPDGLTSFNPMKLYTFGELIQAMNKANACLCIYWDDFKIWKNYKTVSSTNIVKNAHLMAFPNPVNSMLYLKSDKIIKETKLLDASGNLLSLQDEIISNMIDMSNFNTGMYIISCIFTDGQQKSIKIIKQ